MSDYHTLLSTLFHQTYSGPYTFALAAAHCSWRHERIKEYLLQHAEEERTHWRWVLDDLTSTGYAGPNLRASLPHPTTQAYISFNESTAQRHPFARLAIACVLEGIGAHYGQSEVRQLLGKLGLSPKQATFFVSHGETDKVHAEELFEVISSSDLTDDDWTIMAHTARVAGTLYRSMYDHEGYA
ncbi:MAG: iron-containing redox enzyme family protein [Rhodospirillaceae bacterium]|nr:iron-containing redox enzyme family protein [Rhodospirillaceae bacterium]